MTDQQKVREAIAYLHVMVTSSHNAGWKKNREMWEVVRQAALAHASSATGKGNLTVGSDEPVAHCCPDDPFNATAFAWPGSERNDKYHTMPLYTHPAPSAEDARDAARYRWLRNDQTGMAEVAILVGRFDDVEIKFGDELDEAVDQALAAERGEGNV